jgi:hypothetical protein
MDDPKKPPAAPPTAAPQMPSRPEMPRAATGQARVNAAAVKAKIAFQGDDEFSVASLDPETWKSPVKLTEKEAEVSKSEAGPGEGQEDGGFIWKTFRRVFGR